jgi:hypothetical protein
MPEPPAIPIPERHESAGEPAAAKSEPAKSEPSRSEQARSEAPKPAPSRSEPFRLSSARAITQRPPPPPPLPQPPRPAADDTQSVLARLRQLTPAPAPAPAPAQPADLSPPQEARPRPPSPSLSRLAAARAALSNGQIEGARRLLQEAQLQLVFRPIDAPGDEPQAAGKGASDVAHALDALSANDVPLSRRYVDAAVADISGVTTSPPIQASEGRPSGYAPAYPPR